MVGLGKGAEKKTFQKEEGVVRKKCCLSALLNFYKTLLPVSIDFAKLTETRLLLVILIKCTCLVMQIFARKCNK